MRRKLFTLSILSLFTVLLCASTVAAQTVNVNFYGTGKGKPFSMNGGTYWAGEILITCSGTYTHAYCMEYNVILNKGWHTFTKTNVPDTSQWRAVAYVLSWHDPPTTNDEAAAVQGAIWKILSGSDPSGYGGSIAAEASGKDVVRSGDTLQWIEAPSVMGPGETATLKVKLSDNNGNGRANVKIKFSTTGGTLSQQEALTDANGIASVALTAPSQVGTVIEVKAWTRGVWPTKYLHSDCTQDLIGIGDEIGLTTTTNLCVLTKINVVPELPLGTAAAVGACIFAFMAKTKTKKFKLNSL
ncbi:MAG: Ig-like domain-containing protein [Candidatus Bathyarchaeia archaeon]